VLVPAPGTGVVRNRQRKLELRDSYWNGMRFVMRNDRMDRSNPLRYSAGF